MMQLLDMRTIILIYIINYVLFTAVVILLWRHNRRRFAGIGLWVVSFTLQLFMLFLMLLRGVVPDWISIILSNTLSMTGHILLFIGLERFVGQAGRQVHNYVLLSLFMVIHAYFTVVSPNLAARILNVSLMSLAPLSQSIWLLLRRVGPDMRSATRGCAVALAGFALLNIVRIIETVAAPLGNNLFNQSDSFDALVIIFYQIFSIALTFSLSLMVNRRLFMETQTQQATLRESQERLLSTLHSMEDLVFLLDRDGCFLDYHQPRSRRLYAPPEAFIGKSFHEVLPQPAAEALNKALQAVMRTGEPQQFDYTLEIEGQTTWSSAKISARKDHLGQFAGVTIVSRDITDRKQAEQALRASEAQLQAIFDFAGVAIGVIDTTGKWLRINQTMASMLGYTVEALLKLSNTDITHPDDVPETTQRVRELLRGDIPSYQLEKRYLHKDGHPIWVAIAVEPIRDQNQEIVALIGAGFDITDRKRAEEALWTSEAKYRLLAENVSDVIWVLDLQGRFTYVSPSVERLRGYTPEEVMRQTLEEALTPTSIEIAVAGLRRAYADAKAGITKKVMQRDELEQPCKDGSTVWTEAITSRMYNEQGEFIGILGVTRDISDRKRAEEQLRISLEKYRVLFESFPIGVSVSDDRGNIVEANRESERLLGLSVSDHTERHIDGAEWQIVRPDGFPMPPDEYASVLALKEQRLVENVEMGIAKGDQGTTWINVHAIPIPIEGYGVLIIYHDITGRKRMEAALRKSEEQYRFLIENTSDYIARFDRHGTLIFVTDASRRFHGYEADEILHTSGLERIPPEDRDFVRNGIKQTLEIGEGRAEYRVKRKDGAYMWVETTARRAYNEAGEPEIITVQRDITDRKRTEEQITQQLDELRAWHEVSVNREQRILELKHEVNGLLSRLAEPRRYQTSDDEMLLRPTPSLDSKTVVEAEDDQIPPEIAQKWQLALNLIADILRVPAALIMKVEPPEIRVFASSQSAGNPYHSGERATLNTGLYCETVMTTRRKLLVSNALNDERWSQNPDIPLGMISYLGFPIVWPNDDIFGTICALDAKENAYNDEYETLLLQFRDVIETDLKYLRSTHRHLQKSSQSRRALLSMLEDAKHTAIALQEAQTRYRTLFDEAPLSLWEQDLSGVKQALDRLRAAGVTNVDAYLQTHPAELDACAALIRTLDANQTAVAFYEATDKADLLANLSRIFCEASRPGLAAGFTYIAAGRRVCEYDAVNLTFNGEPRFVLVRWVVAPGHEATYTRVMVAVTDITDRKQAEEALQQAKEAAEAANRAKSAFLANMSHELRTPLNGILGYTQILKRDPHLNDKQRRAIETIHRSGEHLLALISEVLDLAKIEAGKIELQPAEFSLDACLYTVVEMIRVKAAQKPLTFHYQPAGDLACTLFGDERRLRQVLLNLLGNAVKFTLTGEVTLRVHARRVSPQTCYLHIGVHDTGIGIPAGKLDEIFRPFEQAHDPRISTEGTGLGLAISAQIVRLMGGDIQVESTPGTGSRFWFEVELPIAAFRSDEIRQVRQSRKITGIKCQPRTILIVDDHKDNRQVLREMLAPLGFILVEAENGQEALEQVAAVQPDLIFLDLKMPVMDGYEVLTRLRANDAASLPVIIAFSAGAYDHIRQQSLEVGCDAFLSKPVQMEEVLDLLETHLHVEWAVEAAETTETQGLFLPPREDVTALYDAALIGDIVAIRTHLTALEQRDPALTPFVRLFRDRSNSFQLNLMREKLAALITETEAGSELSLEALRALPEAWLRSLEQAALQGDPQAIRHVIDQIRSQNVFLAERLAGLAAEFEFSKILTLLHAHRSEKYEHDPKH